VSKETDVVDNIMNEINYLENYIKRHTILHGPQNLKLEEMGKTEDLKQIYKVEGIEFLPEGFIELDPLLLYDEY